MHPGYKGSVGLVGFRETFTTTIALGLSGYAEQGQALHCWRSEPGFTAVPSDEAVTVLKSLASLAALNSRHLIVNQALMHHYADLSRRSKHDTLKFSDIALGMLGEYVSHDAFTIDRPIHRTVTETVLGSRERQVDMRRVGTLRRLLRAPIAEL